MGLADTFANMPSQPSRTTSQSFKTALDAISPVRGELTEQAVATAKAYDMAAHAAAAYNMHKQELLLEVENKLAEERKVLDIARHNSEIARIALQNAMDEAGITKIPLPDRDPIEIKTRKGTKKSITKTWLKSELGKQTADIIWAKVPTYEDKRDLVISSPFNDQPSD